MPILERAMTSEEVSIHWAYKTGREDARRDERQRFMKTAKDLIPTAATPPGPLFGAGIAHACHAIIAKIEMTNDDVQERTIAEEYLDNFLASIKGSVLCEMIRLAVTDQCARERERCLRIVAAAKPDLTGMGSYQIQTMNAGEYMENLKQVISKRISEGGE